MNIIAYLAVSLDGFIADADGGVDWLNSLPNPDGSDYGFSEFLDSIDALLMGANTFRMVHSFGVWPYTKPVFVLSNSIKEIPDGFEDKIKIVSGELKDVLGEIEEKGFRTIYVDGGNVVQNCIVQDLLDELIITRVPLSLGSGISLFPSDIPSVSYQHLSTEVIGAGLVKSHYKIKKRT